MCPPTRTLGPTDSCLSFEAQTGKPASKGGFEDQTTKPSCTLLKVWLALSFVAKLAKPSRYQRMSGLRQALTPSNLLCSRRTGRLLDFAIILPTWPTPSSSPWTLVDPCTMLATPDSIRSLWVPWSMSNTCVPPNLSLDLHLTPSTATSHTGPAFQCQQIHHTQWLLITHQRVTTISLGRQAWTAGLSAVSSAWAEWWRRQWRKKELGFG